MTMKLTVAALLLASTMVDAKEELIRRRVLNEVVQWRPEADSTNTGFFRIHDFGGDADARFPSSGGKGPKGTKGPKSTKGMCSYVASSYIFACRVTLC